MEAPTLYSSRFVIRNLHSSDSLTNYHTWLTQPKLYPYIESANECMTLTDLQRYLEDIRNSSDAMQFSILDKKELQHIGNIKFHNIDQKTSRCNVGFLIGELEW